LAAPLFNILFRSPPVMHNAFFSERFVKMARRHLRESLALDPGSLPAHGTRWAAYAERMRNNIRSLRTSKEVLHFAQTKVGFEHRGNVHHEGKFTALYERELKEEFPRFAVDIDRFGDFEDAAEDTAYLHLGRPVSNVLFYLSRIILSCLTHLPAAPRQILEIGGGYGAPARLWMKNPLHSPSRYIILDVPESLFFSEVVLRSEFGEDSVHYMRAGDEGLPPEADAVHFLLCPLPLHQRLMGEPIDLVINTGSMQEMDDPWVEFYRGFLDEVRASWFYSLNYFAQPLDRLWESGNLYSPRLSPRWTARLLRWNPAFIRMQADRNFLEAIYEKKVSGDELSVDHLIGQLQKRLPCGEVFAEIIELSRRAPTEGNIRAALDYAMRLPFIPKEALWLAERLKDSACTSSTVDLDGLIGRLRALRAEGVEAYY